MNLFQNVMNLQRELCLCNFHIIRWFYTIPGRGIWQLICPHPEEFANFI